MSLSNRGEELRFEGCNFFRLRIAYSLLSGRPIVIDHIRSESAVPGLREHETVLLDLIASITNGTRSEINRTGTRIRFVPGVVLGGEASIDCGTTRCISYFIELLLLISPFCKKPLRITLSGVTNAPGEISVDAIRLACFPIYTKFVLNDENLHLKVINRGVMPEGGGKVRLTCPIVKTLRPVQQHKVGKVCKIRGTAWVTKVSPSLAHRLIDGAKTTLGGYISDVFITVDQRKGVAGGNSPGYGITLWAETTEGVVYIGEGMSSPRGSDVTPRIPEDVGKEAAIQLLNSIYSGGCSDRSAQVIAATFMALGEKDANRYLFGPLPLYTVATLRHLDSFFGMVFKLDDWNEKLMLERKKEGGEGDNEEKELRLGSSQKVLITGIGIGYSNLNKLVL